MSYYIELPVIAAMIVLWKVVKRTRWVRLEEMDLVTDRVGAADHDVDQGVDGDKEESVGKRKWRKVFKEEGWMGKIKAVGMWLFL